MVPLNKLLIAMLLVSVAFLNACACSSDDFTPVYDNETTNPSDNQNNNGDNEDQPLNFIYEAGQNGYNCFRIPAIIKTNDDTLLAFAEGRKGNCGDSGNIDMLVRRSTDGGETWSDIINVWVEGNNTHGNPVPVIDRNTGKISLIMSWNLAQDTGAEIRAGTSEGTRRVFLTQSNDDGQTWTEPKEITSTVKKSDWTWYATGPGHGIQIGQGEYTGRLVVPAAHSNGPGFSHVIYSDDGGDSWQLGGVTPEPSGGTESIVAELSDGRLMLNMRNRPDANVRWVSISDDGGETWGPLKKEYELVEPTCQGSLLSSEVDGDHCLLFSNPNSSTDRVNMTIKLSTNNGESWDQAYTVYEGPSAYSDMVMVSEDEVGIFYESGESRLYEGIAFKIVPMSKIN